MKKILLSALVVFPFVLGCGVERGGPIPPVPDPQGVLEQAWQTYDNMDFENAFALFDSVIRLDNTLAEAHLGYAWAAVETDRLTEAQSGFSFAIILSGGSMITPVFNEIIAPTDTDRYEVFEDPYTGDTLTRVKPLQQPLLGLASASIRYTEQPLYAFDDSTFVLKAKLLEDTLTHTLFLADTLFLNYYVYYSEGDYGDQEWVNLFAHVGNAVATLDVEGKNLMNTVVYGNAALHHGIAEPFAHYPNMDERAVRLLLAQAYFRMNLMENCVRELKIVDPDWTFDGNPYDPDNFPLILEELENLLNGG